MWYHTFIFSHCSIKQCRAFHLFLLVALINLVQNEKFSMTHRKPSKLYSTSSNSKTQWVSVQSMNCFYLSHWPLAFLLLSKPWKHWIFSSLCHQIWGRHFYLFPLLDWNPPKIFSLCDKYQLKTEWCNGKNTHLNSVRPEVIRDVTRTRGMCLWNNNYNISVFLFLWA